MRISIDETARQKIRSIKKPNEKLIWSNKPMQGLIFERNDILQWPLHALMTVLMSYFFYTVPYAENRVVATLFAGLFAVVLSYQLIGRFFWRALVRRKTFYGLTDNSAIILEEFPTRSVKTFDILTLQGLSHHGREHSGDVMFGPDNQTWSFKIRLQKNAADHGLLPPKPPGFYNISDSTSVFELMRKTKDSLDTAK